jgi:hypothetical protein
MAMYTPAPYTYTSPAVAIEEGVPLPLIQLVSDSYLWLFRGLESLYIGSEHISAANGDVALRAE